MAKRNALIPSALEDVALVDGPSCALAGSMSLSLWLEKVRIGEAPQPVVRQPRFTRWRVSDVREYLIACANVGTTAGDAVLANARKASAAAAAKRR